KARPSSAGCSTSNRCSMSKTAGSFPWKSTEASRRSTRAWSSTCRRTTLRVKSTSLMRMHRNRRSSSKRRSWRRRMPGVSKSAGSARQSAATPAMVRLPYSTSTKVCNMKHCIIVGGVAGGATAAAQLRRINPGIRITIYEKGRDISFGNCGLPYNIGGEVSDRNKLIAATPESMAERDITVKTYHEVLRVDSGAKKVTVKDSSGDREFEDEYD